MLKSPTEISNLAGPSDTRSVSNKDKHVLIVFFSFQKCSRKLCCVIWTILAIIFLIILIVIIIVVVVLRGH